MRKIKKILSVMLTLTMLVSMLPAGVKNTERKVEAAVSGIENGATYKIVSAYNGKAITQTDWSTFYADCVVWNTDAMSDFARWKVQESGDYYTFTNAVTDKSIKITGKNNGDKLDLNGNDNSNNYKWKLVPITSGSYSGCFYIVSAVKSDSGAEEYAEIISDADKRDTDGAQVRLWTKATDTEYEPRQIWRFEKSDAENAKFTEEMNDQAVSAFKSKYFVKNETTGYNSLGGGFWGVAEVMEGMLDGYETTGKAVYKEMFEGTYNDFIARNSDDWSGNDFNDDIAWAVLDSVRAYLMFGEQRYLDIAKKNYDMMYARGLRDDGLMIWKMNTDGGTTSCINGPATVAACYLAIATGDDGYYTKAKNIYNAWRNSELYVREGDDAGHVNDSPGNAWCSTYNQGTFIGASTMLYEKYGDEMYKTDAANAMKAVYRYLCNGNILKEENTNSGDLSGMRGILMRYMRKYIVTFNSQDDLDFFQDNARVAWMNRNSQNLLQCSWQKKTSEDVTWDSFAAYNAISLMANMPTYADNLQRDAYSTIEAEDMDYTKGLISENSSGTSGGRSLGGVKNGHYTAYYNVDFGTTGASKIKLKYSRSTEQEGVSGTAEFRIGSTNGPLIAKATLENTGTWQNWNEITVDTARVTGVQNVYVVFKASTDHVCNFDYFTFEKATDSNQGYMVLKSDSSNKYAQCQDGSNNTTLLAKSENRDDWEELRVEANNDGTVSIKSLVSGKYVRAAAGGNGYYITANDDTIDDESKFIIEKFSSDVSKSQQVAIKSVLTGKYLMVDPGDAQLYILANSETVGGAWETFHFETVNGEWIVPNGAVLISSAYVDAYNNIQALDYDNQSGIGNDATNIGGTHNGDWVSYSDVNFGDVSPATFKMSYARNTSSCAGDGYVDVILDDVNNTPITTLKLSGTAPNSWSNYIELEGEVTGNITGLHTVYLKFRSTGTGNVANVAWFTFAKQSSIRDAFSTIEAESHDAFEGTVDYTDPAGHIGNTNAGDWVRYDSVRFDKTAKSVEFYYASRGDQAGGTVSLYLDGMENEPVGTVDLTETATDNWSNYITEQFNLDKEIPAGTHSVYLKFTPFEGKSFVANIDNFTFGDTEVNESIKISRSVRVEGYQISTTLGGNRVVGSVEPTINGKEVKNWGFVYGLAKANGNATGITNDDMRVDSDNNFIKAYESTSVGTSDKKFGSSATATYFVRTMKFASYTSNAFGAEYKVRAYAVLADGSYVYSNVSDYSIFGIAESLYNGKLMNTYEAHNYLYNNILKVVDSSYEKVDYSWGNTIVDPDEME